jgi:hypothetical protein
MAKQLKGKPAPVPPPRNRRRGLRLVIAGTMFLALGWIAGRAGARAHLPAASPAAEDPPSARVAAPQGRRPLLRLRAGDVVIDPEEVKGWAAQDVASLGAKKWSDQLAHAVKRVQVVGDGAASGLTAYLGGWQAVVDETAPYDHEQFARGLRDELCEARPEERALLGQLAPSLPAGLVPACPVSSR